MSDTTVVNCVFTQSLIGLTFAHMEANNVTFLHNYGSVSTNGISMIQSNATLDSIYADNMENPNSISSEFIFGVHAGFISMNYQSTLNLKNSTLKNLRGFNAASISSTGMSSMNISDGTVMSNLTSDYVNLEIVAPLFFMISDSFLTNTNGIYIYGSLNMNDKVIISNVLHVPHSDSIL